MTPKVLSKYHRKGIFSVTQLAYTYKPRRRGRLLQSSGKSVWELKALAIRDKKTFVIHKPELSKNSCSIYIDMEGIEDGSFYYLIGGLIRQEEQAEKEFYFWADARQEEERIFSELLKLLSTYPEATIYHYGSYETKAIKQSAKRWAGISSQQITALDGRMVNLLKYFRTHVYPPTYTNGLKEIGGYLGYQWNIPESTGLSSLDWRSEWESTRLDSLKDKLIQYNNDDCRALLRVHKWLELLDQGNEDPAVQQVSQMKKHSLYKWQKNSNFGDDFQYINNAAYFDYQRTKIYWRNERNSPVKEVKKKARVGKIGKITQLKPKKANEIIIAPPLRQCPKCGHKKLYHLSYLSSVQQTDLKFTASGIKQHVKEYQAAQSKCAKCYNKFGDRSLRMRQYGDNVFALVIHLYVNYHISNEMVSRLLKEQFDIPIGPMYIINYKGRWWKQFQPEVDYLLRTLLNSPVIHVDETPVKLSKDKGYVWVLAASETVYFHFTFNRECDFLKDLLKNYKGVIVTDFFPGYETLSIKRQKCLIHLIRDLNDDLFRSPFDEEFKNFVAAFSTLLKGIIQTIDVHGLQHKHMEKHIHEVEAFYKDALEIKHKSELSIKYAKRLKKNWEELWTFLSCDNVPWNNNNAEAAIKAFAQYRRGINGQIGENGLREYLQMLSLSQTCRYRNVSFLDVLRRKAGLWEHLPQEYLPKYLPFAQARLFMHKLGFQGKAQWNTWNKVGSRPSFIPGNPEKVYASQGWINWYDWLGFGFIPFKQARTYMRKLRLKNRNEYWAWLKSGQRPHNIPSTPEKIYKHMGWVDLGDWLGTGNKGQQKKDKLTYEQTKAYVQSLGLKTQHEFFAWRKSGQRPETVPSNPVAAYGKSFEGWGTFLGTERIANQCKEFRSYNDAKEFLKPFRIQSAKHFRELHKIGVIPVDIPKNPCAYYKKELSWISFSDFWSK